LCITGHPFDSAVLSSACSFGIDRNEDVSERDQALSPKVDAPS
jgi:hypothetical protein